MAFKFNVFTGKFDVVSDEASETEMGVVQEATQTEVNAGTDTGSTGAKLFVTPSKMQAYIHIDDYLTIGT